MPKQSPSTPPTVIIIEPREACGRVWSPAPSLKPGKEMIEAASEGQPEAVAIRDAWQFRHPVKTLPRADYEALIERCSGIVFTEGK